MRRKQFTVGPSRRHSTTSVQQAPSPSALTSLAALAVFSALWALFLWGQLMLTRSGGTPFCASGEDTGCAGAWDSAFAAAVHRLTGLPIAGWGLVWGVAAFVFPLLSLLRVAQRRPASTFLWAGRWMAVSGAFVVFVMIAVSFAARSFCSGCGVIYILVILYAGVTLVTWQDMSLRDARRGLAVASAANGIVFLLLLYPGLKTLRNPTSADENLIDHQGRDTLASAGVVDPKSNREITDLVASLSPSLRQTLSDSLYVYRNSPTLALPPPRALFGLSKGSPVRITEFTDVLCSQCARLYATFKSLRERLPPESFCIEPRQFPLDTKCNPLVQVRHGRSARCLAAEAQICLEGHEKAFEFSEVLFENQVDLTDEKVYEFAAPYLSRPDLERCIRSPETQAKLADDIALAYRFHAQGVPIVLVNGRRGTSFEPFLHAMVLTRGSAFHPAFRDLPEPIPRADLR